MYLTENLPQGGLPRGYINRYHLQHHLQHHLQYHLRHHLQYAHFPLLVSLHLLLFALRLYIWIWMDPRATTRRANPRKSPAGPAGDSSEADTLEPRADTLAPRAASLLRRETSTAPKRVSSAAPAPDGLDAGLPAPWAAPSVGRAHSAVILSISSRVAGWTPANSSPSPRALQGLSAAPASVMRARGGGEAEKGGVPQHRSILDRRLLSSPAPRRLRAEERGALRTTSLRHPLTLWGAMDTWAQKRGAARRRLDLPSNTMSPLPLARTLWLHSPRPLCLTRPCCRTSPRRGW